MDLSAIIVVLLLTMSFFGFVLWAAVHSRKSNSKELPAGNSEIKFSEAGKQNERFLKR